MGRSPHHWENCRTSLDRDGLPGAIIGVLREAYERPSTDPEIVRVFQIALEKRAGVAIVDPGNVDGLSDIKRPPQDGGQCMGFKYDLNRYLASWGDRVPLKNLTEIVKSGLYHPNNQRRLENGDKAAENGAGFQGMPGRHDVTDRVERA